MFSKGNNALLHRSFPYSGLAMHTNSLPHPKNIYWKCKKDQCLIKKKPKKVFTTLDFAHFTMPNSFFPSLRSKGEGCQIVKAVVARWPGCPLPIYFFCVVMDAVISTRRY